MSSTSADPSSLPARQRYWRYAELLVWMRSLGEQYADLVRIERYGSTSEGRPLYVVVVGKAPDRQRPALWIDANMHSSELIGTTVATSFVEDLLALHAGDNRHGLSAAVVAAALEALVYVVPTMSPDGMEAVHENGRFVRSSPVNDRQTSRPRWRQVDLDGDGQVRRLRVQDCCGTFIESPTIKGLMLPREIDDEGPFYALYPEGVIDDYDGDSIPAWGIFDDNPLDLNRNFSNGWTHEPEQEGAGDFAGSSPEARAVMALSTRSPNIYFWINLHTYGGVWIRPFGGAADSAMSFSDRAIFGLVEDWATTYAKVPTVSGFEEFTYVPDKPLRGDLSDYAFHQRGAFSWSVELWDIFARAGLPRGKRFVDRYGDQRRGDIEHLARSLNAIGATSIEPWRTFEHPQLGTVELGGFDPRFSVWNPPQGPIVEEIATQHAAVFMRMLALLPRLQVTTTRTPLGPDTALLEVTVCNVGGVSTIGTDVAKDLPHVEAIVVDVVDRERAVDGPRRMLGHLGGTQMGRFGAGSTWPYQNTEGLPARRRCRFVVRGDAPVQLRVGSQRTGFVDVDG